MFIRGLLTSKKTSSSDSGVPLTDVGGIDFDGDADALDADDQDFQQAKENDDAADDQLFNETKASTQENGSVSEQKHPSIELKRLGDASFKRIFLSLSDLYVEQSLSSEFKVVKTGFFRFTSESMSDKEEIDELCTPRDLDYFILEKRITKGSEETKQEAKRFVFFGLTKDAATDGNNIELCSIGKLLEVFHPKYEEDRKDKFFTASKVINYVSNPAAEQSESTKYLEESKADKLLLDELKLQSTFVFPVRQCRGFFYNRGVKSSLPIWAKQHIVLAVYDAGVNLLNCFDSQPKPQLPDKMIPVFYPEKFKTFEKWMHIEPITYLGTQTDLDKCGYFVHTAMSLIATEGSTKNLGKICLPTWLIKSRENYIEHWPEIHKTVFDAIRSGKKLEDDSVAPSLVESSLSSLIWCGKFACARIASLSQSATNAWQGAGVQAEDKDKCVRPVI